MTGARGRKIFADLLTDKLRSMLVIISLAVGAAAVAAMFLSATTVEASLAANLRAANQPAAVLSTGPFPAGLVQQVADHPLVGQAEGRRLHRARVSNGSGERSSVQLVAMTAFAQNRIGRIAAAAEGQWPPRPGSIVMERASLGALGVTLGDPLEVDVPGRPPMEMVVAGTAFDASEVAPTLGGSLRAYVAMDTIVELTGSDHLDVLYLRTTDTPVSRGDVVEMTAAVREDVLSPAGVPVVATLIGDPGRHPAQNAVSFLALAMQLLSLLVLAVAVALVVSTVAVGLAQQRTQLGVMKSIGATTRQLTAQYLAYVVLLSAIAVALAIPLSIATARAVSGYIAWLANIELEPIGIPLAAIALHLVVGVLLPVLPVVWTVRRASRRTVLDAIADRGPAGSDCTRAGSSQLGRPTVLAYRNACRRRLRLGLGMGAVSLCVAVGVGALNTGSALGQLADRVAGYAAQDVALAATEPVDVEEARSVLGVAPAVDSIEGWLAREALRLRPDGTRFDLTGVPADSELIAPTLLAGRWFDVGDEHAIVINSHLAQDEPELTVGSELLLEVEGRRQQWRVVGIATTTLVGPVGYVPAEDLAALLGVPGTADVLAIDVRSGADHAATAEELATRALDAGLPVAETVTNAELRNGVDSMVDIVVALLLVLGGVLGIVAVVAVAGTLALGVVEETREIAVLRTIGATYWAVRRLLLTQGLLVAAAGAVLGVLLSVPVTLLLGAAIGGSLISAAVPFAFSDAGVAIWTAVALAIGTLGAIPPARMAARLPVGDALAYE
ncbi:FtsX-like permease family protein [Blastococcus sp. VKM Ac-2987]|uniref:FtsX-like permease family protein n=1 Tax=Blastococcus sp. VKM Ac-2987 TaxID=3004141 RepID=UPI0022AB89A4|nr:FtsX-like permease family protein [Blastococcus sp. VKM Ac-2987]MCZ2857459.1 FtsX-like permease family protein [Blastococcus sp. VKM Ac-2987]